MRATETSTDSSVMEPWAGSRVVKANTAGTNRPMTASTSSDAFEDAIRWLNVWVPCRSPPTRMLAPRTSSRLPMIEPVSDALTTSIRPACSAKNAMINSAMLPNVALRIPPTCGPVSDPRRSVDRPTTHARPRIAIAETTKISVASAWSPKSRMTATTLAMTVAMSAIRPMIDSSRSTGGPPAPLGAGAAWADAVMRASYAAAIRPIPLPWP